MGGPQYLLMVDINILGGMFLAVVLALALAFASNGQACGIQAQHCSMHPTIQPVRVQLESQEPFMMSGPCSVSALRDGAGWRGMRAKAFVHRKWASHFWLSIQNFILLEKNFLVLVGWFGLGGWVRHITPPPPPCPPVDKHIPGKAPTHPDPPPLSIIPPLQGGGGGVTWPMNNKKSIGNYFGAEEKF